MDVHSGGGMGIPGYFFQCCPRQRLQYPWVNFTVRPRLDPGIASFLHKYTDADASRRAVARVECMASLYSSGPVCIPTPAEHGCSQNTNPNGSPWSRCSISEIAYGSAMTHDSLSSRLENRCKCMSIYADLLYIECFFYL